MNIKAVLAKRNGKYTEEFNLIEQTMAEDEARAVEMMAAFGRAKPAFAVYVESLKPAFRSYNPLDLMREPDKQWLIKDLIGKEDLGMIFAKPGQGKTFIAFDLMMAAISGRSFAGKFTIAKELKTAYCTEEGLGGLKGRLAATLNRHSLTPDGKEAKNLTFYKNVPQLFKTDTKYNAMNFISTVNGQLDLLIIDTFHNATQGIAENDAGDTGIAIDTMRHIQKELGCAILVVHHSNKMGGFRGSSALHGGMDCMIQVKMIDKIGTLDCFKQKDTDEFKPLHFRLVSDTVAKSASIEWVNEQPETQNNKQSTDKIGDAILSVLTENPLLNQNQIATHIKELFNFTSINPTRKALKQLVEDDKIIQTKLGRKLIYSLPN